MNNQPPKITIVTPTYNAASDIETCILSVVSQGYQNKEHLIVDGQSTDGTLEIIKKYAERYTHIKFISEKDNGIYEAMNKGIDIASGDWIYFLGTDDVLYNDTVLEEIFNAQGIDSFDVVYGNVQWGDSDRIYDGEFSPLKLMQENICHQAIFYKRSIFNKFGKFETKYKYLADYVFNIKWFNKDDVRVKYVNKIMARYGIGGASSTVKDIEFWEDRDSIIKKNFPAEYSLLNEKLHLFELNNKQKEQEIKQKEQQLQIANVRIAQLEGQLNLMYASLSWKITAPLRRLGLKLPQLFQWVNQTFGGKGTLPVQTKHRMVRGQSFDEIKEMDSAGGSIGVHLHLYYIDLLEEIATYLDNIPFPYDLYVSITDEKQSENVHRKLSAIKSVDSCSIKVVPNRGRDVAPFVVAFADELLKYDFICHIHSKKSLYTGNEQVSWRKHFFDNLLGSPSTIRKIFGIFDTHQDVGIIYPETFPALPYCAHSWLSNKHIGYQLCNRFRVNCDFSGYLDSPMGTMFWARTKAISPILSAGFALEDFPEESGQNDGTLAHAMERMFVPVASTQNFTFCEINMESKEFSVSFGSRNLFQYWKKNVNDLKRTIMQYEVITFDIFDTLLTRPLLDPDCVFDLMAMEAERRDGFKNFREIRKRAEQEIRSEKRFGSDVGIEEIYQRIRLILKLEEPLAERLCSREKEIEILLNMPRAEVVNALQFAKENKKRIILMSDMYLDEATVHALLSKNGIDGYDELLLSSELGVRKDNASMWMKLLDKYPRSSILHIGDNEHSDVQIPGDLGIVLYHVMSPRNLYYNSMLGREFSARNTMVKVSDAAVTGMVTAHLFNDPFCLREFEGDYIFSDEYDFGYSVIGPVVFCYMLWLVKSAIREKDSTVIFLAREGYLLKQLFDSMVAHEDVAARLETQIKSVYLLASRRATTVPAIENIDDAFYLLKRNYMGRLHNLLETRFGLDRSYLDRKGIANNNVELPTDLEAVKAVVREHFEAISTIACKERARYVQYLENLGLRDAKDGVVVSDLGYSGNIQKALAKLLGIPLTGYYFATSFEVFDNDRYNNKLHGYYTENDDPAVTESAVYKYSLILESILTSPDGQLVCYTEDGERVRPVFGNPNKQFNEILKIHGGITGYCNDMLKYFGRFILDFEPDKNVSQYIFHKVISERRFDQRLFSLFKIEDNYCSDGELEAIL